jgi:polyphenol oxidase
MNPDWIIPQWPVQARVKALMTTRAGGVSREPYDSLNLGSHVGDHALDVSKNRSVLGSAIAAKPVFLNQVHGSDVVEVSATTAQGTQADGAVSATPGVACTIMVADCLPVLLCHWSGKVVAAAHAGWRGLHGAVDGGGGLGIIESVYQRYESIALEFKGALATSSVAKETLVWLGPCIGPQAFEVGDEVRDAFVAQDRAALALFTLQPNDKWLADLQGLARLRLRALGVSQIYGNDGNRKWCTASNPLRFFSHRRDSLALGGSGRMAACIWIN